MIDVRSYLLFVVDMACAVVDRAMHAWDDEPEMSPAADETDLSPTSGGTA